MPVNTPTVTGYSQFWGGTDQYAMLRQRSSNVRRGVQLLNRDKPVRAMLDAMVNAGSTPSFTATKKSVTAVQDDGGNDLGGVRPIGVDTLASDTIAAGQVVQLDNLMDAFHDAPITYAEDLSGNGGGGKDGF